MQRLDVVAVGEVNVDLILAGRDLTPEFGREKPAEELTLTLGGSTALCAHGMSRLGLRTGFVGVVGDDHLGRLAVDFLDKAGVDTSHVALRSTLRTGVTVSLSEPTDRALLTYSGSIPALCLADVQWEYVAAARHLHLASYYLLDRLRPDVAGLFQRAKTMGLTTSLDTGWDPAGAFDENLDEVLRHTDVFLPNTDEALAITGSADPQDALRILAGRVPIVVVKMGHMGATAMRGGEYVSVPAFPVQARDTTGCGDAFDAGFIYGLLHGLSLHQAVAIGNACGALTSTALGGAEGFPTHAELAAFLANQGLADALPRVDVST